MLPATHASLTLAMTPCARCAKAAPSNAGSWLRSAASPSSAVPRSTATLARLPPPRLDSHEMRRMMTMTATITIAMPGEIDPEPPDDEPPVE